MAAFIMFVSRSLSHDFMLSMIEQALFKPCYHMHLTEFNVLLEALFIYFNSLPS